MDIEASGDLKGILDVLSCMEESEKTIADFYRTCAAIWTEQQEFWSAIEEEEMKHVRNIGKMKDVIAKKPERFEKGRPFSIIAAQTVAKGIRDNIEKAGTGQLPKANALFIARDTEQSFMESKYNEIVKTEDIEYRTLVNEIVRDTVAHKARIEREIKNIASRSSEMVKAFF